MLEAKNLLEEVRDDIACRLYDEEKDVPIVGRARLQLYVRVKDGHELSDKEKEYYSNFLERLDLTEDCPYSVLEFRTTSDPFIFQDDGRPLCPQTMISMMQMWVCNCLGEECSCQVALDEEQYDVISKEFLESYGCRPEESGFSPRGGAMVVEMVSNKAEWLAVQLNFTCVSAFGAKRDMEITLDNACYAVESLAYEFEDDYGLVVSGAYPDNTGLDIGY